MTTNASRPTPEPLPTFLAQPSRIGAEISITGKWVPTRKGGLFRRSAESREMVVPAAYGEHRFGYVKHDDARPDLARAIMVTAKWTCGSDDPGALEELTYWWQSVGTDAYEIEKGLIRFEAYRVPGENALIIHETFTDTDELKFHLSKGTAYRYKKDIDAVASPEAYFFRGPVSWTIRTYSKFMHLPATYTSQGPLFARPGGTMSEGTFA